MIRDLLIVTIGGAIGWILGYLAVQWQLRAATKRIDHAIGLLKEKSHADNVDP